jgi:hypothetical protein
MRRKETWREWFADRGRKSLRRATTKVWSLWNARSETAEKAHLRFFGDETQAGNLSHFGTKHWVIGTVNRFSSCCRVARHILREGTERTIFSERHRPRNHEAFQTEGFGLIQQLLLYVDYQDIDYICWRCQDILVRLIPSAETIGRSQSSKYLTTSRDLLSISSEKKLLLWKSSWYFHQNRKCILIVSLITSRSR